MIVNDFFSVFFFLFVVVGIAFCRYVNAHFSVKSLSVCILHLAIITIILCEMREMHMDV